MDNKVLFVDDDSNILESYKRKLKKLFSIETALGVEQGLTAIKNQGPFSIIDKEISMPGMDGFQFLSRVKEIAPDSVCIILTGHADLQKAMKAVNEGSIFRFLTKPCKLDILVSALTDGIEQYKQAMLKREHNEKIMQLTTTDALTGCYNRTYSNEHLPYEIKRSKRYGRSLSIVLCDIDNFKKVNDTYGHMAGDQVLKSFVQCIIESIRKDVDWIARYGGEEFLIVLPEIDAQGAFSLAKRLCSDIAQMAIEIQRKEIHVTASFGLAGFGPDTPYEKTTSEFLLNTADKFLYQAKVQGKNKVIGG